MTRVELVVPDRSSPRLRRRQVGDRDSFWTQSAAGDAPVFGERTLRRENITFRSFEAGRSKLAAAIAKGWEGPLPAPKEQWLYLGAAGGTTASHLADLVGPGGAVFAVEKSLRPFVRLLRVAERYPNLLPILGDVRRSEEYLGLVPPVEGIYCDLAQPDQVELLLGQVRGFLRPGGSVLMALKTASMGRERTGEEHRDQALRALGGAIELARSVSLEPFHRRHYLLGGRSRGDGRPGRHGDRPRAAGPARAGAEPRRPYSDRRKLR